MSGGKRKPGRLFKYFALLAPFLVWPRAVALSEDTVQIVFALPASTVSANEPVYLRLSIDNGLAQEVRFAPAPLNDSYFDIAVTEPAGSIKTPGPVVSGLSHVGTIVVPPNESRAKLLLINRRYQFSQPGEYKLRVWLNGAVYTASGERISSGIQDLTLRVAPRDQNRLEEACERLAKAAAGYKNYGALREAADTLSLIQDSAAVPYLGQVLGYHNYVSEIAVKGLVRIGGVEAVQVLKSNLSTADPELRMKIEAGIREIETGQHAQTAD